MLSFSHFPEASLMFVGQSCNIRFLCQIKGERRMLKDIGQRWFQRLVSPGTQRISRS
jgi:hypothetical protein